MNELDEDSPKFKKKRGLDIGGDTPISSKLQKYNIVFVKNAGKDSSRESEESDMDEDEDDEDSCVSDENEDSSVSSVDTEELDDYDFDDEIMANIETKISKDYYINKLLKDYKKSKSKNLMSMIQACKTQLLNTTLKKHAKSMKTEDKYVRVFSKCIKSSKHKSSNDVKYFSKQP